MPNYFPQFGEGIDQSVPEGTSYAARMRALSDLMREQDTYKPPQRENARDAMLSTSLGNVANAFGKPSITAAEILAGVKPSPQTMIKSQIPEMVTAFDAQKTQGMLDKFKTSNEKARVLGDWEKLQIDAQKRSEDTASADSRRREDVNYRNALLKLRQDEAKKREEQKPITFGEKLAEDRFRFQVEDKLKKDVQDLQKKLGPAQDALMNYQTLDAELGFSLDDYDPKTNTVKGKKVDVPGVSWPIAGRISMYSTDSRNLNKYIARIFNIEMKARGGSAVTESELNRLKGEYAMGRFNTEEELLDALKEYKSLIKRHMSEIEKGTPPKALDIYQGRGGLTSVERKPSGIPESGFEGKSTEDLMRELQELEGKK